MRRPVLFQSEKRGTPGTSIDIEVVGVPSDLGHSYVSGTRHGPDAIRTASQSVRMPVRSFDHGDIGHAHEQDWQEVLCEIEEAVADILLRGSRLVLLGGDHAISYAAVAATATFDLINIVWFDAHTDFCNWSPAEWHNHKQVLRRIATLPHVGKIVQIGHRGITYFDEIDRFERVRVIRSSDMEEALDAALETLDADAPVYMSIDIDAIDPRWAPGTGHPVPGGLSVAGLGALASAIAQVREVAGIDLMEVNPLLDQHGMTSDAAVSILAAVLPHLKRRPCAPQATAQAEIAHQEAEIRT